MPLFHTSPRRHSLFSLLACALTTALAIASSQVRAADATDFPNRPVKLVVGFAPGGATDALARLVARKLSERNGQPFVVDNRPGAATRIGMEAVQRAAADGYTIGLATAVTTTFPEMFDGLDFAPGKDFAPIALLGRAPSFITVRKDLPVDYQGFVDYACRQGSITLAHPGNGSNPHIAGLALAKAEGLNAVAVAYRGTQPMVTAVGAGEVDFAMAEYAVARPMLEADRVRLLAVTEPQRSSLHPDIPTTRELGISADVEGVTPWFMLIAPAGTPPSVVEKLNHEAVEIMALPDVREQLALIGVEAETQSPEGTASYFLAQRERIVRLVRELGLSLKN